MILSNHANPNSVWARNARMVASAARRDDLVPPAEPRARDVKGHVNSVGSDQYGVRLVYFTIRHGSQICLRFKATETEFHDRLLAAKQSGECLEIIYADTNGFLISGDILTIC